jgi:DNA mismatch repair protein MutL
VSESKEAGEERFGAQRQRRGPGPGVARIQVLPREVAEKIAAGEVIERPAAVVKELAENSIDAGATRVTVETEAGGKSLLRVSDDATGMTPEEAHLAIQPHATSKIRTADDLFAIHSLGFRGEALPSIAAVSQLELLTRMEGEEAGTRLLIEGGRVVAEEPAAAPVGTSVTVRRLFFNLPARQKFLRAEATEAGQITELIQRLAVAHHRVTFRLIHDQKETVLSPGSDDPFNAVIAIWGRAVARDLLRVGSRPAAGAPGSWLLAPGESDPIPTRSQEPGARSRSAATTVSGFVGRPSATRANRHLQWFYVNGRFVRSPLFYRALDEAYRASMPQGRYPLAVLFLEIDPAAVDVNVHPSKIEVRFRDEVEVYEAILEAVRGALSVATAQEAPAVSYAAPQTGLPLPPAPPRSGEGSEAATADTVIETAEPAIEGPPRWPTRTDPRDAPPGARRESGTLPFADAAVWHPGGRRAEPPSISPHPPPGAPPPSPSPSPGTGADRSQSGAGVEGEVPPDQAPAATSGAPGTSAAALPELTPLGQTHDLFMIAEGEGRLWVIDQHVAHERILFERLANPQRRESAEPLLFPLTLPLDQRQALVLEEHRELLNEMGFAIEPFGDNNYIVRAVPLSLVGKNYEQALRDMVDELSALSEGGRIHLRREQVAMAAAGRACKAAVKAGKSLSRAEMIRLLADLRQTRNPYTCPHGRPIFLTFDEDEIAALFGGPPCG